MAETACEFEFDQIILDARLMSPQNAMDWKSASVNLAVYVFYNFMFRILIVQKNKICSSPVCF